MTRFIHIALAIAQPLLAWMAAIFINRLIKKGLSHRLFRSLLLFFILIFILTLWHLADDLFGLEAKLGEIYEFPSYILLITGFAHVIFTAVRSLRSPVRSQ
ncbi:MAG: hypothetical protein AAB560_03295 [Patescibacteria group bacterium]